MAAGSQAAWRAAWARTTAAAMLPILLAVVLASGALFLNEPLIALTGAVVADIARG